MLDKMLKLAGRENGLLDKSKHERRDFTFDKLYRLITNQIDTVYDGEIDAKVDTQDAKNPAERMVGEAVFRSGLIMLTGMFVTLVGTQFGIVLPELPVLRSILVSCAAGVGSGGVSFLVWLMFASGSISDRSGRINLLLPEALSFMYAQSKSDVNYLNIIRSVAMAKDAYGPVAREFQIIVRRCEYFGEDIQTAIEKQANATPSTELARILHNFKSHIEHGADITTFLKEEAEAAREDAKNKESAVMEQFSLVNTLYMTVGIAPVFILAVIIGVSSFQNIPGSILLVITYIVIPAVSTIFIFIIEQLSINVGELGALESETSRGKLSVVNEKVDTETDESSQSVLSSTFGMGGVEYNPNKQSELGGTTHIAVDGVFNPKNATDIAEKVPQFSHITRNETKRRVVALLKDPIGYFTQKPVNTLFVMVPLVVIGMVVAVYTGSIALPSIQALLETPVDTTTNWFVAPFIALTLPMSLFQLVKQRQVRAIEKAFPDTLSRLVSANDSGLSLTDSIKQIGQDPGNIVDREIAEVAAKAEMGVPIDQSLVKFNNRYKQPEVARGTRLLNEAYKASSNVSDVLKETIASSRTSLEMKSRRRAEKQSRMLTIGIISFSAAVILVVVDSFFIGLAIDGVGGGFLSDPSNLATADQQTQQTSSGASQAVMELSVFHAALLHSGFAGMFMGYLSTQSVIGGFKYADGLMAVVVGVWMVM